MLRNPAPGTAPDPAAQHPIAPTGPVDVPLRPALRRVRSSPALRLALLLSVLAAAAASLLLWDPAQVLGAAAGPWRLPVALAAYALGTLAFLPRPALNTAVGLLLGAAWGLPVAVAGSVLGAALSFGLGRGLGRAALRPFLGRVRALSALDRRLTEQGFRSVLLIRLIPGTPFQAGNYACAFSGVGFRPFLAATSIGVVPSTAAYVVAGASAATPGSPAFLLSTGVIVAMSLFSLVSLWRARRSAAKPSRRGR